MNIKLNKPLLSLIIMTGITATFFCGVGAVSMIAHIKVDDNAPKDTAIVAAPAAIAMMPTNEDSGVACGVGDKMWQPAVWNTKRAQDTRLIVRF